MPLLLPEPVYRVLTAGYDRMARRPARRASAAPMTLRVRQFEQAAVVGETPSAPVSECDGGYRERPQPFDPARTALVLVDVWATHPNAGWQARATRNIEDRIGPLVEGCRKAGVAVVHAPHGLPEHALVGPLDGELVVGASRGDAELTPWLTSRGIHTLLYAGYASNVCLLNRSDGLVSMAARGFDVVLVRDASLAIETPETAASELSHHVACTIIELNWGPTTMVQHVVEALGSARGPLGPRPPNRADRP